MNDLRKSSECNFPYYYGGSITYIEIQNNGTIKYTCASRKCDMRSL